MAWWWVPSGALLVLLLVGLALRARGAAGRSAQAEGGAAPSVAQERDLFWEEPELDEQTRTARRRELIKKVRRLEIITRKIVNEQLAGSYHAVFKGRGMDFDEVRLYQPGDEPRFIDWNVSARMGEVYIKRFVEERELTTFLLVDVSASQRFGTGREKREAAAELAAMLALSAVQNNDRVGLILFSDRVEGFVPPKKGRKHALSLISRVLDAKPEGRGTKISAGLDHFARVCKRRSVAFVISDFLDGSWERSMLVASQRHDMVPVVLLDPAEETPPELGTAWLQDPETGEVALVDTASRGFRERYTERAKRAAEAREKLLRKLKVEVVRVQTDQSSMDPLVNYFRVRAKR
jgi:uncharacterized protein (DUF58 family)